MAVTTTKDVPARLVFVYNADSGPVSALMDAVHKLVSPQTYACSLCFITYGPVAMRTEWKRFIEGLPYPSEFLHRDQFRDRWPELDVPLPAILMQEGERAPDVLVGADEMAREQSVAELIALVEAALARRSPAQQRPGWSGGFPA